MADHLIDGFTRRHAYWRRVRYQKYWECTQCGYDVDEISALDYCPYCGSKMVGTIKYGLTTGITIASTKPKKL